MHTVRIVCRYVWVCSLMTKLIPNSDLRHGYSVDPFVSQTARRLSALPVLNSAASNAVASEHSRSDKVASASIAAQSFRTSGVRFSFRQDEREGVYLSYHVKCGRYRRTAVCISSRRWTASSTVCEA